jgi:hypothetical protein
LLLSIGVKVAHLKAIIGSARSFSPFRRHDETRNQLREMGAAVAGFLSAILT